MTLLQILIFFFGLFITAMFYFAFLFGFPLIALKKLKIPLKRRLCESVVTISFLSSFYSFACWYFVKTIYMGEYFIPMTLICILSIILNTLSFKMMYKQVALWKCFVTFLGAFIANFVMFALIAPAIMPNVAKGIRFILENY